MSGTPDNLIRRFGRRVFSGKLRKPPSSQALNKLSKSQLATKRNTSNGSLTALLLKGSSREGAKQMETMPAPPMWASIIVFTVNMMSLVGIATLGPSIMPPKQPGDAVAYITAAIPFFVLQMAVEQLVIKAAGIAEHSPASAYDLADSWSASNSGIMQQIFMKIVLKPIAGGGMYIWVYNSTAGLPFLPRPAMESWAACIALFVCVDFAYYWLHRSAHVSAVLWLGHSVHHDSEHYNNSTALRQGMLQAVTSWMFSLPLALVFPPRLFLTFSQFNTLYQFWVHTCCIRRLGILEYVLMTPSHHRVHHDRRVHKNFGGVLIVWDRLFGSFLDELAVYKSTAAAKPARQTAERVSMLYLGGPSAVPVPAETATPKVRREEKVFFGQKRAPTTWTASVTQLPQVRVLLDRLAACAAPIEVLKTLMKGPGFYTAGMRRRNALPAKSSGLNRFRLVSKPAATGGDLSAYQLVAHTVLIWAALGRILVDKESTARELAIVAAPPVMALVSQGLFLDGGPEGVSVERARCLVVALASAYHLLSTGQMPWELATWTSWLGLVCGVNCCSAVLMAAVPHRFQRQLLSYR